jgi:hypothetical protein
MTREDVKPFLLPPTDAVRATEWVRLVDGKPEPLAEYLSDWDQNTVLVLRSSVEADINLICSTTELSDSALSWAIGWRATDSGLIGAPTLLDVDDDCAEFQLTIPPRLTGNTILVTRRLVLNRRLDPTASPLRAHLPGSILWSDEVAVRLSGKGAAFPVEVVDFSKVSHLARLSRNSWYLELPASVDQPVLGGMLLMVNSGDAALVSAVSAPRPTDDEQTMLQAMQESVVEQLVNWALSRWEDLPEPNDTSVGSVARLLTERILADPETWASDGTDSMDLHAAIIEGARRLGLGRTLL